MAENDFTRTIEDAVKRGACFCTLCGTYRPLNAECPNGCKPYFPIQDTPPDAPPSPPDFSILDIFQSAHDDIEQTEEILKLAGYPMNARYLSETRQRMSPILDDWQEQRRLYQENLSATT